MKKALLEKFIKSCLLLEAKNSGLLALVDELYVMNDQLNLSEEEKFKKLKNEISMYLGPKAPAGSSRIVFPLDADHVIKLALNPAGFAQNGTEAMAGSDDAVSNIINPVTAKSNIVEYDGFFWIVQKKILPLKDDLVGSKNWSYFQSLLMKAARDVGSISPDKGEFSTAADAEKTRVEIPAAAAKKLQAQKSGSTKEAEEEKARKRISDALRKIGPEFFDSFREFLNKYSGSRTADLFKPDSWGMTPDGKLKLIDYGYTRQISDKFYDKGYVLDQTEIKKRIAVGQQRKEKNVASTAADNEYMLMNINNIPPLMSLLLLIKGIVIGLPRRVEEFEIGKSLSGLTETEKTSVAGLIRGKQEIVEKIINQVSNQQLKNKLYDELDEILLSTGSLGKTESLIRLLVKESLRIGIR
jgi:hypothetical protein